jgi:hypothetical protein
MDLSKTACIALALATSAITFTAALAMESPPGDVTDEIIVVGNRQLMALRLGMLDAEREAYEVFNQFNDERRFEIHCDKRAPTGSRLVIQVCEPEFEIQAKRTHAQNYLENTRDMLNQLALGAPPVEIHPPVYVPPEFAISSQQEAYRGKLKQVAEEHPEFLDALVKYVDARKQYEDAVGKARK